MQKMKGKNTYIIMTTLHGNIQGNVLINNQIKYRNIWRQSKY
jgi:hypothetical protein